MKIGDTVKTPDGNGFIIVEIDLPDSRSPRYGVQLLNILATVVVYYWKYELEVIEVE